VTDAFVAIESVEPVDVLAPGGVWPGLDIRPRGSSKVTIFLDEAARREVLTWLR
jgi:hypothetical protein